MSSRRLRDLPRSVWLLGWVSLATDAATEAIYPLLPMFLTTVLGAGAVSLGIIEGAAEATNSVLKIISGRMADRAPSKRGLVLAGYAISSAVRPFIAVATGWVQVLGIRIADRLGKGIRGAPRDAMLAALARDDTRGQVFGFHQAMDHLGAVIGPLAATAFLFVFPGQYRWLFGLTIVPGAIAVALILLIKEEPRPPAAGARSSLAAGAPKETLPPRLIGFLAVLTIFTLGNSSDAFLLLKLTEAAGGATFVPLMWAALHVVKASVSVTAGSWSDRVGRRIVVILGWLVYAVVYAGFAFSTSIVSLLAWFLIYGLYFGFTEGTSKALVADLSPASRRGFAFGLFNAVQGLGALAASVVFGLVWTNYSPAAAFGLGASLALAASLMLLVVLPSAASTGARRAG
ncbi:MAG TPA: MFS transporter [Vicinamibacterales bacterium]|nr:MFS transporter [Vicinamibacterales bacterium]